MAQIDKFIEALHGLSGERLVLTAGAQVTLGVNGNQHTVTGQPVSAGQVEQLLREIAPGTREGVTAANGGHEFDYDAPSGPVRVAVQHDADGLSVVITPAAATDSARDDGNDADDAEADDRPASRPGADAARSPREHIDALFRRMVEEDCSDLHLCAGAVPLFRKDGEIVALGEAEPVTPEEARAMLLSITPDHKQAEFETEHDTDFAYEITGVARFRCNLFMDRRGMGGVFRVIPSRILSVEELGLSDAMIDLCKLTKGLVLVTGPTGSGKSTTLAAMIDFINRNRAEHVVTIEDPIEFVHDNKKCLVNQREVGVHTRGFKVALRAALREDPDVVMVGELRDLETVAIALETAETGHLVFGTLHTNTAASTVDRIIDQFPADQQSQIRTMLAEGLKGVISQTLVRAKGGGRLAAMEFLLVNSAIANLIREGKTYQIPSVMQTSKGVGMRTLNDCLVELVKRGEVEPTEAYKKAVDKSELEGSFKRNGIHVPVP